MSNYLIILSGGVGTRMGADIPKQYLVVEKKPILYYTVHCFDFSLFKKVVIVASDSWRDFITNSVCNDLDSCMILFAPAGKSRQESILNGMSALREMAADDDIVVIHDGARPNLSKELVKNLIEANDNYDGVMPVLKVKDTVYRSIDGKQISSLLNRDELYAGQAPESFKFGLYYRINTILSEDELANVRGSSEIAFAKNLSIGFIAGEESNFKITTPDDLERFKQILVDRK